MYDEESESPAYSSNTPINFDAVPVEKSARLQQAQGKQKQAWDEDFSSYVDSSMLSKPTPAAKSYGFFDAWVTVLTSTDIESYESVLNDPEAGAGRAFEWVAYAGIISGLIFPFSLISNPQFKELINMPEFNGLFGGMSMAMLFMTLALAMALLTPISSLIGLAIGAGIQNMLAVLFGGRGYYGRTVYALAAYLAPMTILVALLGAIPLVGQCLTSLVGFYNIFLNVRAIRAAHSLSVGQALGVMFAPGILLIILACLIVFVIGSSGISN
jgi:hypothetical protein